MYYNLFMHNILYRDFVVDELINNNEKHINSYLYYVIMSFILAVFQDHKNIYCHYDLQLLSVVSFSLVVLI